jgi:hypothetical protein
MDQQAQVWRPNILPDPTPLHSADPFSFHQVVEMIAKIRPFFGDHHRLVGISKPSRACAPVCTSREFLYVSR